MIHANPSNSNETDQSDGLPLTANTHHCSSMYLSTNFVRNRFESHLNKSSSTSSDQYFHKFDVLIFPRK